MTYDGKARELCIALAVVCETSGEWKGAAILRRVAAHLYRQIRIPKAGDQA